MVEDPGDVGVGFHVVEQGGLAEQALYCREGRPGPGLAPVSLDRGHQGSLLAAHESAGAQAQLNVKGKAGAQDVSAQKAVFSGLSDGDLQPLDGDGVLRPDIDVALAGSHGVAGDGHSFNDGEGIPLQHGAVHEGAGIALVGVAADILYPIAALGLIGKLPLHTGGEAGAAPAPQAGLLQAVDDFLRGRLLG